MRSTTSGAIRSSRCPSTSGRVRTNVVTRTRPGRVRRGRRRGAGRRRSCPCPLPPRIRLGPLKDRRTSLACAGCRKLIHSSIGLARMPASSASLISSSVSSASCPGSVRGAGTTGSWTVATTGAGAPTCGNRASARASTASTWARCQPRAERRDVPQGVPLPDHPHRSDALVDAAATGEHHDGAHLARGETDLGEVALGGVCEVSQPHHVVGDVLLAAEDALTVDADLPPRLGVDDEHPARPDHDEVDLGTPAAGPATVGEQVVADGRERGEGARGLLLGDLGDAVAGRAGARLNGGALVRVGESELPAGLGAGRTTCCHVSPFLGDVSAVARARLIRGCG